MSDRGHIDKLARIIAGRDRILPPKLTGSTTAGGTDLDTRQDRLPLPIGAVGDRLEVIDDSGDIVPAWVTPTGGGVLRYRQPTHASYGGGSYLFDSAGDPVYTLADLEA